MTSFMRNLLLLPLLMIVHPVPSYCDNDKHLSAIIFLVNSKPLVADIVAKATTQFGDQVNASVAILISADRGYSWSQIINAIVAGTLKADGSIVGVSPQQFFLHQKAVSGESHFVLTNYSPISIRDAVESNFEKNKNILSSILRAACLNYTSDQIILALTRRTLLYANDQSAGFIDCYLGEWEKGLCILKRVGTYNRYVLLPDTKEKITHFKDCNPRITIPLIIPKGCWRDGSYWVTIEDAASGYKYTGDGYTYKHSGIIKLKSMGKYEGTLQDEPGYCCGNHGDIWLEQPNEDNIRIRSIWYDPWGYIIKETDWQDLVRVNCP